MTPAGFLPTVRPWSASTRLIDDALRDPTSGIGEPEPLRRMLAGAWSRRITEEHRFVHPVDERHHDWETPAQAAERFEQGVRAAPPGDVLIGTHGMCLTAWLVSRAQVEAGEAAADFWQSLTFPDVITVPR